MSLGTVILVPGNLGSVLGDAGGFLGSGVVWLNPVALLSGGLRRMRLRVPGEAGPDPPGLPLLEGYPLPLYYGLIETYLGQCGWDVVSPAMDFRYPLMQDAARLATLIREKGASRPVKLLCHSRGGLVARAALGMLAGTNQLGLVNRVVGLGVPHTGSLNAAQLLACWQPTKLKIEALGKYLPWAYNLFLGIGETRAVIRSWPSQYELLPAPSAPWLIDTDPLALYSPGTYAGTGFDPVPAFLAAALAGWSTLPPVPSSVDWIDVAGNGTATAIACADLSKIGQRGSMGITNSGDGTVSIASAAQSPRRRIITPTQHDMLVMDGRLWPHIHGALLNGLGADLVLAGNVLNV